MKKLFVFLTLLTTLVSFGQVENQVFTWGKDDLDTELLTKLIEKEINKVRRENGLDTLVVCTDLRKGALKNSTKCANMLGLQIIHTEKEAFEVAQYSTSNSMSKGSKDNLYNIAKGFICVWMMSPPHRKAILKKDLKYIGCGIVVKSKILKEEIYVCDRKNRGQSILKTIDVERYCIWASVRFKNL